MRRAAGNTEERKVDAESVPARDAEWTGIMILMF